MTQRVTSQLEPSLPSRITYKQFLNDAGIDAHSEWVDGRVVAMAPVSGDHQDLAAMLVAVFRTLAEERDLGVIRQDPFQMRAAPDLPGRAPDVLFVAKRNVGRLKKNHLEGPADLVIEIISEGSRGVDRGDKFYEYEKGGVLEYWLLDPIRKEAEFYRPKRDGHFHPVPVEADGIFRSAVMKGLWIDTKWLWTRPSVIFILGQLGLI